MFYLDIQPARTTSALQGAATAGGLEDEGHTVEEGYVVVETQAEADALLDRYSNLELDLSRGAAHEPDAGAGPERDGEIERAAITGEGVDRPGDDGDVGDESNADGDADDEGGAGDAGDADGDEKATEGPPVDPTGLTVAELREAIADIDSVAALEAIGDAEEASKNRASALEAIDGRISAVRE